MKNINLISVLFILFIIAGVVCLYTNVRTLENFENFENFGDFSKYTNVEQDPPKKIAFCFLIYDKINHLELWEKFFEGIDPDKYNVYIHYKSNQNLGNFDKYKLPKCVETKWADKSLVKASNLLFTTAFKKDSNNYKFVLLSNSCIPLKPFNAVYDFLTQNNKGHINSFEIDRCGYYCKSKFNRAYPHYLAKCSQWVILNRLLVEKIASVDEQVIDKWFSDIWAPDEMFYYSFIKLNNLEDQVKVSKFASNDATTFIYWNGMNYKFNDPIHEGKNKVKTSLLKNYEEISDEEIGYLMNSACLFGRKFTSNCLVASENGRQTPIKNYLSNYI
jgi:hypothetical protein